MSTEKDREAAEAYFKRLYSGKPNSEGFDICMAYQQGIQHARQRERERLLRYTDYYAEAINKLFSGEKQGLNLDHLIDEFLEQEANARK